MKYVLQLCLKNLKFVILDKYFIFALKNTRKSKTWISFSQTYREDNLEAEKDSKLPVLLKSESWNLISLFNASESFRFTTFGFFFTFLFIYNTYWIKIVNIYYYYLNKLYITHGILFSIYKYLDIQNYMWVFHFSPKK